MSLTEGASLLNAGQTLCQACGLCCRGVWFVHVPLAEDEIEPAGQAGLSVTIEATGKASFLQPCVLHQGNRCTAYDTWRPEACVQYSCALLKRHEAGAISLDEALERVHEARTLADRLQTAAGPSTHGLMGDAFLSRLTETSIQDQPDLQPLSDETKLDAVALRIHYKKYFQVRAEPKTEAEK